MAENLCPQCGAPVAADAKTCKYCGEALAVSAAPQQAVNQQQPIYQQPPIIYNINPTNDGINPGWPIKSKIVAGVLAILLGGLGIHKFYMGKTGLGILYLLFCWTAIPAFVGFIEGIIYLCSNDHNFQVKYHCRLQ